LGDRCVRAPVAVLSDVGIAIAATLSKACRLTARPCLSDAGIVVIARLIGRGGVVAARLANAQSTGDGGLSNRGAVARSFKPSTGIACSAGSVAVAILVNGQRRTCSAGLIDVQSVRRAALRSVNDARIGHSGTRQSDKYSKGQK